MFVIVLLLFSLLTYVFKPKFLDESLELWFSQWLGEDIGCYDFPTIPASHLPHVPSPTLSHCLPLFISFTMTHLLHYDSLMTRVT